MNGAEMLLPLPEQAELGKIESQRIVGNHVRVLQSSRKLFNECLAAGEQVMPPTLHAEPTSAAKPLPRAQVACVRLLGLMGRTHLESGSCTNALPYLLACASHCDSLGMEMEGASASVSLAEARCLKTARAAGARKLFLQGHSLSLRLPSANTQGLRSFRGDALQTCPSLSRHFAHRRFLPSGPHRSFERTETYAQRCIIVCTGFSPSLPAVCSQPLKDSVRSFVADPAEHRGHPHASR